MTRRRTYGTGSIYQRSDGYWVAAYAAGWSETGKRRRVTAVRKTRAAAVKALADLKLAQDTGAAIPRANMTVKQWATRWLEGLEHDVKPQSLTRYEIDLRRRILPIIGARRIRDLRADDIRRLVGELEDKGLARQTISASISTTRAMLRAAEAAGHPVPREIMAARVRLTDTHAGQQRGAMTARQARQILDAAHTTGPILWARSCLALLQGLRQGEVLGLEWSRVNLGDGTVTVAQQLQKYAGKTSPPRGAEHVGGSLYIVPPKTRSAYRTVPLVAETREALQALADSLDAPTRFVIAGAPPQPASTPARDLRAWYRVQAVCGVARDDGRPFRLHEARHTTATLLMEAGVAPEVIRAVLGHASVDMQAVYQHASIDAARAGVDAAAALLNTPHP